MVTAFQIDLNDLQNRKIVCSPGLQTVSNVFARSMFIGICVMRSDHTIIALTSIKSIVSNTDFESQLSSTFQC